MRKRLIFALVVVSLSRAWAQTPAPAASPFLLRLLHVKMNSGLGTSECIIVYNDGRFHRERLPIAAFGGQQASSISEGALPAVQRRELISVLKQPALANFSARDEQAKGKDVETLTAVIPRANVRQVFTVSRADTAKLPAETAPLLDWFTGLPAAKFTVAANDVGANSCRPAPVKAK